MLPLPIPKKSIFRAFANTSTACSIACISKVPRTWARAEMAALEIFRTMSSWGSPVATLWENFGGDRTRLCAKRMRKSEKPWQPMLRQNRMTVGSLTPAFAAIAAMDICGVASGELRTTSAVRFSDGRSDSYRSLMRCKTSTGPFKEDCGPASSRSCFLSFKNTKLHLVSCL